MKTRFERAERTVSQTRDASAGRVALVPRRLCMGMRKCWQSRGCHNSAVQNACSRTSVLIDLRHRLAETKWPDQLPGTTWEYGADIKKVRELADYWQNGYDWRAQEAKINRFDQFTTEIDGQQIYFIHQRSPRPDAIPLHVDSRLARFDC